MHIIPKNGLTPEKLNPHLDLYGRKIVIGSKVRSYDFPWRIGEHEYVTHGDKGEYYIEGIVMDIVGEGECGAYPHYVIQATKVVRGKHHEDIPLDQPAEIVPPANGTRAMMSTQGLHTWGVFNVDEQYDEEDGVETLPYDPNLPDAEVLLS